MQALFIDDDGCIRSGYTKVMIEALGKPMVYTVKSAVLQCGQSGGPSPADVSYCMDRMRCWARMAVATARAEFPEFTVMYAMSVFKLTSRDLADRHVDSSAVQAGCADTFFFNVRPECSVRRLDAGIKRKASKEPNGPQTLSSFIKNRRCAVAEQVRGSNS